MHVKLFIRGFESENANVIRMNLRQYCCYIFLSGNLSTVKCYVCYNAFGYFQVTEKPEINQNNQRPILFVIIHNT